MFRKSTRSTIVKTIGFPRGTKLMKPHDINTILNFWPITVDHITLDLVLDLIINCSLHL